MSGFASDLYAGTAEYYQRFRPRYPEAMLDELRDHVGSAGKLVDLACGPGQIAIPMAGYFKRVVAVDQEPDMIEIGRKVAEEADIDNISWQIGKAENHPIRNGTVDMLAIGSAFHRLDRQLIAARAKKWLSPGGILVVMGYGDPPNAPEPKARWQVLMSEVVQKWTGPPSEATKRALSGPLHGELLRSAGYAIEQNEWRVPHRWTLDELIGLTFSISVSSRRQLGDKASNLEAELRSALLDCDSSGMYDEELRFFAIVARPCAA